MNSGKVIIGLFISSGLHTYMKREKYLYLGNNSRKILLYMNSESYVWFDNNSLKISILVCMNSEKYI